MLYNYKRRISSQVNVGNTPLGGNNPIRLQSMTNTVTMDTQACIEQCIRIIRNGADYVRLTAQGEREANNLKYIRQGVRQAGFSTPLVADIHFNPKAADAAAVNVEKVRINPGNYVDSARTFKKLEYTDEEYQQEILKIRNRLVPFLNICKEHHTAIRIGVNHGSLSDRIMSRYGDTPEGMVESCMEFLRICVAENFMDVVISIKASNTVVMVRTVRLLVDAMNKENMAFPLHLGVTEAGEGEDGRIKSAIGIGALLSQGIGDTIRVSLSEAPELEVPVARKLVDYVTSRTGHSPIIGPEHPHYSPLCISRRTTYRIGNIGENQLPVVIADSSRQPYSASALQPDYIYIGMNDAAGFAEARQSGITLIADETNRQAQGALRLYSRTSLPAENQEMKFVRILQSDITSEWCESVRNRRDIVILAQTDNINIPGQHRAILLSLSEMGVTAPVVLFNCYNENDLETLQIKAGADLGANLIDRLADGVMISNSGAIEYHQIINLMFGVLQAARLRVTKTEYISCPGCGRTLFDLQSTIARVKAATAHLTGLKIGIMGCVVNGPGEMADADYGYVGAGRGRISLYKNKECIEKNLPEDVAVEKLIELIRKYGDWKD